MRPHIIGFGPGEPPDVPEWALKQANDRGWTFAADYIPPFTSEETGEEMGGFWTLLLYRDKMVNNEMLFFAIDVPKMVGIYEPERLNALCDLAEAGWEDLKERQARDRGLT